MADEVKGEVKGEIQEGVKNENPTPGTQPASSGEGGESTDSQLEKSVADTGLRDAKLGPLDDINFHRMADSLDISYEDRKVPHIQEKIAFLTDWAQAETKSDDRLTQALAIKDLCRRLGFNLTGKEMVTKLYKWSYLDLARKRIEMQQKLL